MRYMVVLEQGEQSWRVHAPGLPGCVALGDTRAEALRLIGEAIDLHIEDLGQNGLPASAPSPEAEFIEVSAA